MNRRGFLQAILSSATAPYVITTAGVLMPVKKLLVPDLTETSLEELLLKIAAYRDDRGIPIAIKPTEFFYRQYGYEITNDGLVRLVNS